MSDVTKNLVREAIREAQLLGSENVVLPVYMAERFRLYSDFVHAAAEREIVTDGERVQAGEYTHSEEELRDRARFLVNVP